MKLFTVFCLLLGVVSLVAACYVGDMPHRTFWIGIDAFGAGYWLGKGLEEAVPS